MKQKFGDDRDKWDYGKKSLKPIYGKVKKNVIKKIRVPQGCNVGRTILHP
jgi:hypothetical protein